ncbi:MAG: DUF2254 domain-containing protein [Hyphomicrobiaceae bacterium]|nr:DUF2254 domain-containing protein [Hyphomicrobiaceae bacterium]
MIARLQNLWKTLRTSLWFFPGAIALVGALLAWFALSVHIYVGQDVWWLYGGDREEASSLLSSFLNSLITVSALAISITMVVLTLSAQQLGPRLIGTVVASWQTQMSLGTFVAAILYLVLVLRSLPSANGDARVPDLAVTIGTGFVILCTFALLFFTHFLSRAIVADTIIERVGSELDEAADRLLPDAREEDMPAELIERTATGGGEKFSLQRGGYVQSVDYEAIAEAAEEQDAVLRLHFRPGSFLIRGGEHVTILKGAQSEALTVALAQAVSIGSQRTTPQDLEYAIRQLVEVAMRGMYVWDVYTCTAVLDRLALSLARIMQRGPQQRVWCGSDRRARLLAESVSFESLASEAFNQIRQGGERFPAVLIQCAWVLEQLFLQSCTAAQRRILAEHARMVVAAGRRTIREPADLSALERRVPKALAYALKRQASGRDQPLSE